MPINLSLQTRRSVLAASASAVAAGLLPTRLTAADSSRPSQPSNHGELQMATTKGDAIRPFSIHVPEEALADLRRRINADEVARAGDGHGRLAGRAARDDAETRALLGDRLRLAQGRGAAQRPAAFHHRDRRARHSFHSRPLEA